LPSPGPVGWAFPPAASEAAIDASTLAAPVECGPLLAPVYQPVSTVLSPKPITWLKFCAAANWVEHNSAEPATQACFKFITPPRADEASTATPRDQAISSRRGGPC
jgi:hypothetical protein